MVISSVKNALSDIKSAAKHFPLAAMLGWQDIRQRYRRSAIGPFWITISMAIMIGTMGIVFGQIFKLPLKEFLPFIAIGTILWGFISSTVNDGCNTFIASEGIIKQLPIPLFVHITRMIWRNLLILGHNLMIFPFVLFFIEKPLNFVAFMFIPGFILFVINLIWIALILGVICARYRDLPQIVNSIIQVLFYLTPVIWMPNLLPDRAALYLLDLNPLFHLFEIVRSPLLGQAPTLINWVVALSLGLLGWVIALIIYGRYLRRIAFWL